MGIAYLDASALVKLVVSEAESAAMFRWFVEADRVACSRIGVVETLRASYRRDHDGSHRDAVLAEIEVIELDAAIATVAATVAPPLPRSLDAIHLATALALVPDLEAFVTYDDRLAGAARTLGLPVVRPA
jgi:predicted nucleic acid-binding protein